MDQSTAIINLKPSLNHLMQELKLPAYIENGIEFLEEYLVVMAPIANALSRLQAEKTCL